MNRQHPYGGYDAGPPDRGNRSVGHANGSGYGPDNTAPGGNYYPTSSPSPAQQSHLQHHQTPQHNYNSAGLMSAQNDYHSDPGRSFHAGGSYPPQGQNYQPSATSVNAPPGNQTGRPALTLGPGPLNSQSQYGAPSIHFDGNPRGQSTPIHNPPSHYGVASPSPGVPPPMRPLDRLPPKPDSAYASAPSTGPNLGAPPSHLPRPPGRDWGDEHAAKRARQGDFITEAGRTNDDIIKDRLKRERPCRTLFVRNVEFNADIADLKRRFESFGEIKSWFDLTSKRGLLFISYFDLRCAEYAKAAMQEFEVNGRRMDVHYSLPRESEMTKRCDRDKDQGTLFILLKRAQGELIDEEVRATFATFGEVKSIRRYKDQGNCRFLEYYDCRACKKAHDAMIGASWNGGTWDIKFAWDAAAPDHNRGPEKAKMPPQHGAIPPGPAYAPDYGRAGPPAAATPHQYHSPAPVAAPNWGNEQQQHPPYGSQQIPGPTGANYPSYNRPPSGDFRPPPPAPAYSQSPPTANYGTKRPFDHDERAGPDPPMRRWGQPQGAAASPPGPYGRPSTGLDQGGHAGYGSGSDRPTYGANNGGAGYAGYGGAERDGYSGRPPPPPGMASGPAPNRWEASPQQPVQGGGGYGQPPAGVGPPTLQRPIAPLGRQQQQHQGPPPPSAGPSPPSNEDRLEQAQKVQQLLASLKSGNLAGNTATASTAPRSEPAGNSTSMPTPPPAATPSLPSNIAALLQMAQSNAAKK